MPKPEKTISIKDQRYERQLFFRRTVSAFIIILIMVSILVSRLVYLQIQQYDVYQTLSTDNRVKLIPLPPTRGLIYDRNGKLLATNRPSFRLEMTPEEVGDIDETIEALKDLVEISDDELERFHSLLRRKPKFEGIPLKINLSDEEVARFSVNRQQFPGVEIQAGLLREYPYGESAVHAIGYVGRLDERDLQSIDSSNYRGTSHIGKSGIEKSYEPTLHGEVGYEQIEINAQGRTIRVLERKPPVPGTDLHLTMDIDLQLAAEQAFGEESGALVAINPENGDVLAFVSKPTFDPNLFVQGISQAKYTELSTAKKPLWNRALRGQYPPGSTLKPFVGLAALEYEKITESQVTYCPGYYTLPNDDHRYRDWKKTGHGRMRMHDAIVQSCDVYFYDMSLLLGIDNFYRFLSLFGLGEKTGIDMDNEEDGLLPSREWKRRRFNQPWFPGETLIAGIGQGFTLTTPLQLASITATLSRYGKHVQPRLLYAKGNRDNESFEIMPVTKGQDVPIHNLENWNVIIAAMQDVVHGARGTARSIGAESDYLIAGKTGTAQVFTIAQEEEYEAEKISKKLRDHALFVSFAPVEAPKIAVAVIVENGGSGGAVAAPIAKIVMDKFLESVL